MEEALRRALAAREIKRIKDESRELSAVLVPIYCRQDDCWVVFTRRTEQVRTHKKQISFPGGAYQPSDGTLLNTAIRECGEEIGLPAESIKVLGALDDIVTTSGYIISPFVGVIPWPHQFKLSSGEIAEIIEAPVSALLGGSRQREEVVSGKLETCYFYHYQGTIIWGATATIMSQFLQIFTRAARDHRRQS